MTDYQEPAFPALFREDQKDLSEFDRDLITVLNEWNENIKAILEKGISFDDNLDVVSIEFTSSGTPDAENALTHTLGKVPTGFIVYSLDKGAVAYDGTTANTNTTIHIKVNTATVAVKAFVF